MGFGGLVAAKFDTKAYPGCAVSKCRPKQSRFVAAKPRTKLALQSTKAGLRRRLRAPSYELSDPNRFGGREGASSMARSTLPPPGRERIDWRRRRVGCEGIGEGARPARFAAQGLAPSPRLVVSEAATDDGHWLSCAPQSDFEPPSLARFHDDVIALENVRQRLLQRAS
jgi:hypothetical protein